MSKFSEDAIETLDDWNGVLGNGCCCDMPECPVPTKECQSISIMICGYSLPALEGVVDQSPCGLYANVSYNYSDVLEQDPITYLDGTEQVTTVTNTAWCEQGIVVDGASCDLVTERSGDLYQTVVHRYYPGGADVENYTQGVETSCENGSYTSRDFRVDSVDPGTNYDETSPAMSGACSCPPLNVTVDWTVAGLTFNYNATEPVDDETRHIYTHSITYSNPIDLDYVAEKLEEYSFPEDVNGSQCLTFLNCDGAGKFRFKWVIPDTFVGSYFKITWDILDEPIGWDDEEPEVERTYYAQDQTWEWTGPGDPEDADSWKSGWYEIPVPTVAGERRVVNVRFQCYRGSTYGVRPQVTGEAVELAETPDTTGSIGITGTSGKSGATGKTGGLRTGTLQTSGLRTGGLRTGSLTTGSLRTSSLKTGGLKTGTIRSGSLRTGTVKTGSLRTSSLKTGGLSSGGLRSGGLRTSSL